MHCLNKANNIEKESFRIEEELDVIVVVFMLGRENDISDEVDYFFTNTNTNNSKKLKMSAWVNTEISNSKHKERKAEMRTRKNLVFYKKTRKLRQQD